VIDRSTGTIRGRAVFDNPAGLFTPGMFARIQVASSPAYEALLVPDAAVGTEQVRKFVYVVDAQNMAQQKYVTLGIVVGDMRVIKDGLAANDRVIIDGVARIRPKQKVTPQEKSKTATPDDKTASAKGQPASNAASKPDSKTDPKSDAGAKPAAPKQ
jgi:RND family efflux transporter MFP subunit